MLTKYPFTIQAVIITAALLFFANNLSAQSVSTFSQQTTQFLRTLSDEERKQTKYSFSDTLRLKWTNLPVGLVPRPGIAYGSLSDSSRIAFHRLLSAMLSSQGYLKITSIMQLDDILNTLIQQAYETGELTQQVLTSLQNLKWSHGNFFISVWGEPQNREPWGINFGGHHVALNITVNGKILSMSPLFLGTDPAEVRSGKYAGWRVLSKEEDYGFLLLHSLSEIQKRKAVLNQETPKDIITHPNSSQRITGYYGLSAKELTKDQKAILQILIQEYTHNFDHAYAHVLYDKITRRGLDKIYFAWIGSQEKHQPHYYLINGPDFLIEYDNYPGSGNHIHLILREKGNDFGEDILKQHYLNSEHHKK
jgi:hypothetical protein